MKRVAILLAAAAMVLFAIGPAAAYVPTASASPSEGPAGSSITVILSGFTGGIDVEVHGGSVSGPLLGSGTTNGAGIAGIPATIPAFAPVGPYTLVVCGVGPGIPCGSEFSEQAVTTFDVTPSIPPPVTTTATTTTVPPVGTTVVPAGDPCVLPEGARVIDFDSWDRSLGDSLDVFGGLQEAMLDEGHDLWFRQWASYEVHFDPPDSDHPNVLRGPRIDSLNYIADNPARDLYTTSPPNVLRLIDDSFWTLAPGFFLYPPPLPAGPVQYIGFNVGFGHFSEGFERPENVYVELRVRTMPMEYRDGTVLDQGAWDPVGITLGPGPQPVAFCLMARNTLGAVDPLTIYQIDIVPRDPEGGPLHIPLDIDDLFYGIDEPPRRPALLFDEEPPSPVTSLPEPSATPTLPDVPQPIEEPSSDLPWRLGFGLGGVALGAAAMFWLRRR